MKSNLTLFVALALTFAASIAMADAPPEPQNIESGKHQGPQTVRNQPREKHVRPGAGTGMQQAPTPQGQAAGATPLAPYDGTTLNPKINTKLEIALFPRRCA